VRVTIDKSGHNQRIFGCNGFFSLKLFCYNVRVTDSNYIARVYCYGGVVKTRVLGIEQQRF
jgi:hypothetical protein